MRALDRARRKVIIEHLGESLGDRVVVPLARIGGRFHLCSFTESHADALVVQPPLLLGDVVQHPLVRQVRVWARIRPSFFFG